MTNHPFRFGMMAGGAGSRAAWITLAQRAEELGYSTLLLFDRLVMGIGPLTALSIATAVTKSLRVGSYVFCNDYRHPAILAKEIATLDLLSEGRVELGLGAGAGPQDLQQIGLPFESAGIRVARLEEALTIIKSLFTEEKVNFSGKYYTINEMRGLGQTLQQRPHPPLLVAAGQQRMLSLAAQQADIVAIAGRPGEDVSLEQKINWIREAAGERFKDLELAQTIYTLTITDSQVAATPPPGMPLFAQQHMSTEQAVEHLLELRERYSISYLQVFEGQMENFAPVVARLAGK
jgi:probable F420-dependent oxidoreductase